MYHSIVGHGKEKMTRTDASQNAVSKALRMLSQLAQSHDPLRLGDIADAVGVPKSSVHRTLTILIEEDYVESIGDGYYRPGNGLRVLAAGMEGHSGSGIEAALSSLQREVGHTVFLAVLGGDVITYTHKVDPGLAYAVTADVGSQVPLTSSAAGKTILAHLPDAERREHIADDSDLTTELPGIRARGFAVDYGNTDSALCSIAAAVLDTSGYPLAAVCVSSLTYVLTEDELQAMSAAVKIAADEISHRL